MSIKKIPIDAVRLGMYIVGIDQSWLKTPFFSHRFLLKKVTQLNKLNESGIRYVDIDTEQGLDVMQPEVEDPAESPLLGPTTQLEEERAKLPDDSLGFALSNELNHARDLRKEMMAEVQEVLSTVRTSGVVDGGKAKNVAEDVIAKTLSHEDAVAALIRTREFSPDLYDHSLSVCTLSVLLGRLLGYEKHLLHQLAMASLLHDIGLLQLPSNVVRPLRSLSETEQKQYHQHPDLGIEILKKSQGVPPEVIEMIAIHHQPLSSAIQDDALHAEWDAASRVLRVVDAYDELLTGQGQQKPLPVKDALSELYQRGQRNELDLNLVSHLINQIGIYPIYSLVELNTGERGIITAVTPGQLLRPVVLVIQDSNHLPYENPIPINFSTQMPEQPSLEITEVLDAEQEGVPIEEVLADWVAL